MTAYASTSEDVKGTLWRCLDGLTHIVRGWSLYDGEQVTYCGISVRYRRGEWLYEALGLAPTYTNCLACTTTRPWSVIFTSTITGRMSSAERNLTPRKP